ncbi:hypothetical protein ME121_0235 [Methylobacterium sp. ME121]|jgi:uncharacterized small protein (DUF1192 family)|nr:hypothetical protein ME121_0235 [Methylobacterium sp. ME121]
MAGMVTENGVWTAADRIRARPAPPGGTKERVSVRTVRRELGGGSFGDIARELRKWKDREDYRPAIERADLPEAFERRLTVIGRELLEMARVEAARAGLADFVGAEDRRAVARDLLDEALDRVDLLEERVAALQAELDRVRAAGTQAGGAAPPVSAAGEAGSLAQGRAGPGFVDTAHGLKLAREANDFWGQVRDAVEAAVRQCGPMAVHPLLRALPTRLKEEGERAGFPLTEAWLRYHLLRLVQDGNGLTLVGHRFGLADPDPEPDVAATPEPPLAEAVAAMGKRPFWRLFMREVHALLARGGAQTAEGILGGLDPELVAATGRFQRITPRLLRWKLRQRIAERRPFEELPDGRFAALMGEAPWDGESPAGVPAARAG